MNVLVTFSKTSPIFPLGVTIVSFILSVFLYGQAPPQIPIWYSLAIPEQQLATREFIFVFPLGMLVFTLLHAAILARRRFYEAEVSTLLFIFTIIPLFLFVIGLGKLATTIL